MINSLIKLEFEMFKSPYIAKTETSLSKTLSSTKAVEFSEHIAFPKVTSQSGNSNHIQ